MQHKLESEYSLLAWCKSGIRTHGPGESPQSLKVGPQDPLQSLKEGPSCNNSLFDLFCFRQICIYYGNNFPRIVIILSYILCSELIHHFGEIFNITYATVGFFFGGGWRDPCNLLGVQLARQFMKLKFHLSDVPLV